MAYSIEKSAKTVQDAITLALEELKTDQSNVDIEILDEGNKGFFGFFGNKMARVKVIIKESRGEKAKNFLLNIFEKLKVAAELEVEENEDSISLRVKGKDIGIIIGRRGETLDSLQYLSSLVVNKGKDSYKRVVIDIENYRQKREETLERLANRLAEKVVRYRKDITLESMNPYERRIIHSTLQNNRNIRTFSIGEEPNRKVVITLK